MARGRKPSGNPVARGTLGHSMMSAVADLAPSAPAVEQGAEPGSDLQTELQKLDRAALTRSPRPAHRAAGERAAAMPGLTPIVTVGAAAIIIAAIYKAARRR